MADPSRTGVAGGSRRDNPGGEGWFNGEEALIISADAGSEDE
jgi:hypothetical protein